MAFLMMASILSSISWINGVFLSLNRLIADIRNWGVFASYTLQMLPNAIFPMLPFASFIAAAFLSSRMLASREFAIYEFSGARPFRLAMPFALFGICVALAAAALVHHLVPSGKAKITELDTSIAADFSLLSLKEGQFLILRNGLVIHIDSIADDGSAKNVFVHHRDRTDTTKAYFAESTQIVQRGESPYINMEKGRFFELSKNSKSISSTSFDKFEIGFGSLLEDLKSSAASIRHFTTIELMGRGS